MNRYYDIEFRGKKARLYFDMNVYLDVEETYDISISELYSGTDREVFDRKCYLLSLLSYEGKRIFKDEGFEGISLTELEGVLPFEMVDINNYLDEAFKRGFSREFEPQEVDEGLAELKKKNGTAGRKDTKSSERESN